MGGRGRGWGWVVAAALVGSAWGAGVARAEDPVGAERRGRRVAVIAGVGAVAEGAWDPLANAVPDAEALAGVLRERYGFAVKLLVNPKAQEFKEALSVAAETAQADDDLLVFVAGHGHFDAADKSGSLVMGDATKGCELGCYPLDRVKRALFGTKARHVLVMIDACYGGVFELAVAFGDEPARRGSPSVMREILRQYAKTRSRLMLASVGKSETLDGTPGRAHSPFARVLLGELGRPGADGVLSVEHLALLMREGPAGLPIVGPTMFLAQQPHEVNGTFLFVAEGDFCEAAGALAEQAGRAPVFGAQARGLAAVAWGASGEVGPRLPGAEACVLSRFDTDGRVLVRCRFGAFAEADAAQARAELDKRLGLCSGAAARGRTSSACDEGRCALSVVFE